MDSGVPAHVLGSYHGAGIATHFRSTAPSGQDEGSAFLTTVVERSKGSLRGMIFIIIVFFHCGLRAAPCVMLSPTPSANAQRFHVQYVMVGNGWTMNG